VTDHPEDETLENKSPDNGGPASSDPPSRDINGEHPDFDHTIDLGAYTFPDPDSQKADSTTQFDSMESLFEELEEESAKPDSRAGKEDTHAATEPEKPADEADGPGINTDELDSLNDKNNALTTSVKKIELTEGDYADIDAASTDTPQTSDEISDDMLEDITEPENAINSQVITAAANEAHALQDKPEITADDKTPKTLPAEEPAVSPAPHPHTGLATALGLISIIGASGALWISFGLSDRMDQLESQITVMQNNTAALSQHKDINSLSQRVDELNAQLTAHLKTVARAKEVAPVPDVKKPPVPAPVVTKPSVTAIKPAMDSVHGAWVVNLTSLSNSAAANNELVRLKHLGIHAESVKIERQGKTWYRIRVAGFSSAEDADRQRKILGKRLGIRDAWTGKR